MTKLWVLLSACFVKKDDPELLIPPADYDAEVLESSGFTLCIDAHPDNSSSDGEFSTDFRLCTGKRRGLC